MSVQTLADQCEIVLNYLIVNGPSSIEAMNIASKLSYNAINNILCDLRLKGRVTHEVIRIKGKGKTNVYSVRVK